MVTKKVCSRGKRSGISHIFTTFLAMAVVCLSIVAGMWRCAQLFGYGELKAAMPVSSQTVVVSRGDTLWTLAVEHGPQGEDPRVVVARIREMNQLQSVNLRPGTTLRIPDSV